MATGAMSPELPANSTHESSLHPLSVAARTAPATAPASAPIPAPRQYWRRKPRLTSSRWRLDSGTAAVSPRVERATIVLGVSATTAPTQGQLSTVVTRTRVPGARTEMLSAGWAAAGGQTTPNARRATAAGQSARVRANIGIARNGVRQHTARGFEGDDPERNALAAWHRRRPSFGEYACLPVARLYVCLRRPGRGRPDARERAPDLDGPAHLRPPRSSELPLTTFDLPDRKDEVDIEGPVPSE